MAQNYHVKLPFIAQYLFNLVSTAYVVHCSQRDIDQAKPVSWKTRVPAKGLESRSKDNNSIF